MHQCFKQPGWYAYFTENMEQLGLPVPTSWYSAQTAVTGSISSLIAAYSRFGVRVTLGELLKAGTKIDGLVLVSGLSASWYLGGAVGSAAVATGRYLACGTRMIDVLGYAARHHMFNPTICHQIVSHPEIYDMTRRDRRLYGHLARVAA